jgi:tetratricopeptide (TPR) repeat protein
VSIFWFLAGMLTMFAALIVILPWLRTIPRFESLPSLPWQAPLLGLLVVGAALAMYLWLGRPDLAAQPPSAMSQDSNARASPSRAAADGGKAAAGSMTAAIDSLRARLAKGSGSADDWELLAKSYEFVGRPDDARQARAHQLPAAEDAPSAAAGAAAPGATAMTTTPRAAAPGAASLSPESLKLLNKAAQARHDKQYAAAAKIYHQLAAAKQMNADAWADYADTAGVLQNNKLAGEPETYIANALALDANHPKALWLKASAEEEAGRYNAAIAAWQRLQDVLPQDSQDAKIVAENLQRDKQATANSGTSDSGTSAAAAASISGEVSISSTLSSKATPGATLFIVAKSVDQPGPPVAVYRGSVSAWPVKFTLDDSSSMLPGRNLTNAKRVTVEARISRSGQAQPAAGDLRGTTGVIDPSSHQPLKIVINEVVS